MGYVLTTAPTAQPIDLPTAKQHLNVDADITADDTLITALIAAVVQYAEQETGRSVMPQTWRKVMDYIPMHGIELEKGPVTAITSLTYTDMAGVTQTMSWGSVTGSTQRSTDGSLVADLSGAVARISVAFGHVWPIVRPEPASVAVTFTCGYANADAVPQGLKHWMLLRLGTLYKQREDVAGAQLHRLPHVDALLNAYTIRRV